MYDPKGNGKQKTVDAVAFTELEPPSHLRGIVHRFLELKTAGTLAEDYRFHALPDACTYLVFDQLDRRIAGVAKLRATSEEFNLGKTFHFFNIRFLPGVWQGGLDQISYGAVDAPYDGELPLLEVNQRLASLEFADSPALLSELVEDLITRKLVAPNPVTQKIFQHLDDIHTVADMAEISNLSARQLQRTLKRTTGFAPHDFLKVLRLQQTLNGKDIWSYADQSHFIHSFRKATGYTPGKYARKFDV
ncbi:helix-turn-helix transcriptional regulator [Sulfitobacter mediterraneus]|uniref:Transcriptional regulator n=1 Tax=Sulfitobacter mediterraneus TaxID=83219 RepID=A0A061SVN3_9RHOB|nr:AraC family transcriptional regulator [Sulfitobacter mediterraneus]KAJ03520.1 transcriptional regulator [Sulfitobacter mediterraneus]MBM1556801.1 helix-turn-helix transcriptional regulator [Sulfitobacter mediterraneus]MBM1568986.1 helix-turn-helix transcriptional regulator [Sulfitobacter mediterraneus]MBM1572413.1 helix-turn-helix transcriptional regulator [Sulfitobacter mediterraneus]MBM1576576.1 helix-turn-helix transcriptional regulator [Sulfitobacter mediterraneus]